MADVVLLVLLLIAGFLPCSDVFRLQCQNDHLVLHPGYTDLISVGKIYREITVFDSISFQDIYIQFHCTAVHTAAAAVNSLPVFSQAYTNNCPVCAELHTVHLALLWQPSSSSPPFKTPSRRSPKSVFCLLLLLAAGDIELNPGPSRQVRQHTRNSPAANKLNNVVFGCYNVRSANNKSALIHDIINDFHLDVLALTETWITSDAPPAIKRDVAPAGFHVLHVHRHIVADGKKCGGGLAVIYRNNIKVIPHPLSASINPKTFELQVVKLVVPSPVVLLNIYKLDGSIPLFLDELADVVSTVCAGCTDRVLVTGDLNCPGVSPDAVDERLEDILDSFCLTQHVKQPTRIDNLLDILATDSSLPVCDVRVDDAGHASDHRLVTCKLAINRPCSPAVPFNYRRINSIDTVAFQDSLRRSPLFAQPAATVDDYAEQIRSVVSAQLDRVAPVRTFYRRPPKQITKWLSPEAIESKRGRRKLERIWRSSGNDNDRAVYRRACRRANWLINTARRDYFKHELDNADPKCRWRTAKQLLHSSSTDFTRTDTENQKLCTVFGQYFIDKIANLKQTIADKLALLPPAPQLADHSFSGSSYLDSLQPVTKNEVLKLLHTILPKSSQLDFIPTSLIKSCSDVFSDIICQLANLSFSQGKFPSSFKLAYVSPLLKRPGLDPSLPANYRPISNLNNISKILEKLFLVRLQPHVTSSLNFNPLQSAYRPLHSTETALLFTLDSIYRAADQGHPSVLVSLDLSAAFDTIDHHLLLTRLYTSFGIRGSVVDWLSTYLSGRTQRVAVGQACSALATLSTGVPQGSVLGPLLFTLYTSPIGHIVNNWGIHHQQYADDTQLFISLHNVQSISHLEGCLSDLYTWFCNNGLSLNPDKSDAIHFCTSQRARFTEAVAAVNVAGTPVSTSDSTKTLGITLDNRLSFTPHVQSMCKSCNYHIRALRHIRPALTDDMAKSIATSLVSSRLDYCNSLLHGCSKANIAKLQRIQNSLARVVTNCYTYHTHSSELLYNLHWLPIKYRIDFKIATLTFKLLAQHQPSYLSNIIHIYNPPRTLRSSNQYLLDPPSVSTAFGARAFSASSPSIWNLIPLNIRQSPSLSTFKHHLKTCYFTDAFS